jgi:hypothetical protein
MDRLFDFDPETGLKTIFHYDEESDRIAFTYSQEVDPVLDANKASQAETFGKRGDLWHAARIPVGIQYEWLVKHGVNLWDKNHKDGVRRLLNSSDYRYLRVNHFII